MLRTLTNIALLFSACILLAVINEKFEGVRLIRETLQDVKTEWRRGFNTDAPEGSSATGYSRGDRTGDLHSDPNPRHRGH